MLKTFKNYVDVDVCVDGAEFKLDGLALAVVDCEPSSTWAVLSTASADLSGTLMSLCPGEIKPPHEEASCC